MSYEDVDIDKIIESADQEERPEADVTVEESVTPEQEDVQETPEEEVTTDEAEETEEQPEGNAPIRNRITVEDDAIIQLEDMELTKEELKKLVEYRNNDNKWKQKNEERGKRLNQAEALQHRIEADKEFADWVARYQDSRERELLEQYDEDTAKAIRRMEQENLQLKHQVTIREAEEQYEREEAELLENGMAIEDIASAYELLNTQNPEYFRAFGKPMPLKEAFAKYLANGGQQLILERERKKLEEKIKLEGTKRIKASVPRDLGSSASIAEKQLPTSEDPLKHPVFDLDIFKEVRDK